MSMSLKVIVPPHPLIKHWLSILREKNTPNILYSTGYEQIEVINKILLESTPNSFKLIKVFNVADFVVICPE